MRRRTTTAGLLFTGPLALLGLLALSAPAVAAPSAPAPERGEERWRITGRPVADGCGGRIVLAAQHLSFRGRSMFADVVNRRYDYARHGDRRVAEGTFGAAAACPNTQIDERWELRQQGEDTLSGQLTSTWHLAPACEPCTVRFRVRAVRVR